MRRLKKLGVCLSLAIAGAMIMAVPACAKEKYNDVRDSYISADNKPVKYSDSQKKALYENCRVKNPNDWYLDDYIKDYANEYKDDNYVGDLRVLNQYGLRGVTADYDNTVFDYGIWVTDNPMNPSWHTFVFKCSDKDYKKYLGYNKSDETFKQINENSFEVEVNWGIQKTYYYPQKNIIVEFVAYYK